MVEVGDIIISKPSFNRQYEHIKAGTKFKVLNIDRYGSTITLHPSEDCTIRSDFNWTRDFVIYCKANQDSKNQQSAYLLW